jgi:Kef-type K+ transport system membrane component KefB/mannitol/fructose-specific phosphotransferase system IIA component (Ntr-type)
MATFTKNEIIILFLSIALMLGMARFLGEIFRRIKLPSVVGEILAGVIIGPTVLGRIFPDFFNWIFPAGTRISFSIEVLILLGVTFLLFTAGIEVELSSVLKQGRSVILLSSFSIAIPLAMGIIITWWRPDLFGAASTTLNLSLFIGITLSITALPIIAKILLDLNLLKSDFGMLMLTSAMINDLFGWLLFSVLIQLIESGAVSAFTIAKTILLTITVSFLILTLLRYLINQILPWIQARTEWPGGVITFTIIIGLILAAITETIGIHAIFGAFLAGIAIGDSPHLREHTKEIIHQFINNIFAPLFFLSIGLRIDFIRNFDPILSIIFILIVVIGKISGSIIAGKLSRFTLRDSALIGSGMSASGAMGIILGIFALEFNIINHATFEAIVIMAVVTSLISSPLMKFFMRPRDRLNFIELIESKLFIPSLKSRNYRDAIRELSGLAERRISLDKEIIAQKVLEREGIMSTGIGDNIAVPHARLEEIERPSIIIGLSRDGIDFNAPDGKVAHIIFMILTSEDNPNSQIQILCAISNIFLDQEIRENAIRSKTFSEFISTVKFAYHRSGDMCEE